jgi:hypothetical protein
MKNSQLRFDYKIRNFSYLTSCITACHDRRAENASLFVCAKFPCFFMGHIFTGLFQLTLAIFKLWIVEFIVFHSHPILFYKWEYIYYFYLIESVMMVSFVEVSQSR